MSLIPCIDNCIYQIDGYCTLEHAASSGAANGYTNHSCAYCVAVNARSKPQTLHRGF